MRMQNVITKTIESDIAQYAELKAPTAKKTKKDAGCYLDTCSV